MLLVGGIHLINAEHSDKIFLDSHYGLGMSFQYLGGGGRMNIMSLATKKQKLKN